MPGAVSIPSRESVSCAAAGWRLEHSYAQLPPLFHVSVAPTPVRAPRLVILNLPLAEMLGLDVAALAGEQGAAVFAGNQLPPGAKPIAQAYAGHQYGHFTTLGDGRAILLGEQITPRGERFDIQLKGAGSTPYSRLGDGRAALSPMLREYIISEAMHALGIPTTRSLAVTATGEDVYRQVPLTGAVLTRVAASHIRVGTFEWAAARGDHAALRQLVDYSIQRHFPGLPVGDNPVRAFLAAVIERQAALIAQWMLVGFVHGVMNTDNMAISGETIDYGPCAFMEAFNPRAVFSSIDKNGRYAYGNQPAIAQWNLSRLAETLLTCIDPESPDSAIPTATEVLETFPFRYQAHWLAGVRAKLGIGTSGDDDGDFALANDWLALLFAQSVDYTLAWRRLADAAEGNTVPLSALFTDGVALSAWLDRWSARCASEPTGPD